MHEELIVSLKDPVLNEQLPSYSITRGWEYDEESAQYFGKNDSDEILKNYWENAITVSSYLKRLHKTGVLSRAFKEEELFKKLLVKLHLQQSLGVLRDKPYNGRSTFTEGTHHFSHNWQKEFRKSGPKIIGGTSSKFAAELKMMCALEDSDAWFDKTRHKKNVAITSGTFDGENFESFAHVYIPPSVLPEDPIDDQAVKDSLDEVLKNDSSTSKVRSSIYVVMIHEAFVTGKLDKSSPYLRKDVMKIVYPAAVYIPRYLEKVRVNLEKVIETNDKEEQLRYLARAYQAGIRSQAFETVWNSEMMGIVNFFLTNILKLKPIAHEVLDFKAFLLSPEAFEKYFKEMVERFDAEPKKELPVTEEAEKMSA
jgi:hypothetical protein